MKRIIYKKGDIIGNSGITFVKDVSPKITTKGKTMRKALFVCSCGKEFETSICYVRCGDTKSCGCKNILSIKERFSTHGMTNSKYYKLWTHIKARCLNENCEQYKDYGGRGIKICKEWVNNFEAFYNYISKLDDFGVSMLTLDRINNDGNYKPENLRWTTMTVQCNNQRIRKDNTSGVRGVSFNNIERKWKVRKSKNGNRICIGTFKLLDDAIKALNNYKINKKQYV